MDIREKRTVKRELHIRAKEIVIEKFGDDIRSPAYRKELNRVRKELER
jgi:hypothetical protein